MKPHTHPASILAAIAFTALSILFAGSTFAEPLGTAFTYQGQLAADGNPANGSYDLSFSLFGVASGGTTLSNPITNTAVAVSNGLFTVPLDFGQGVFTGDARWLEIAVRSNGVAVPFAALSPRQPLLPVPYAVMANSASNLLGNLPSTQLTGTIPAANLTGTISLARLPAAVLTNNATSITLSGSFSGSVRG